MHVVHASNSVPFWNRLLLLLRLICKIDFVIGQRQFVTYVKLMIVSRASEDTISVGKWLLFKMSIPYGTKFLILHYVHSVNLY